MTTWAAGRPAPVSLILRFCVRFSDTNVNTSEILHGARTRSALGASDTSQRGGLARLGSDSASCEVNLYLSDRSRGPQPLSKELVRRNSQIQRPQTGRLTRGIGRRAAVRRWWPRTALCAAESHVDFQSPVPVTHIQTKPGCKCSWGSSASLPDAEVSLTLT
jgi:hypothetical protein